MTNCAMLVSSSYFNDDVISCLAESPASAKKTPITHIMPTSTTSTFDDSKPRGMERVQLETTVAEAEVEAPTREIVREIEANAERAHDAAHDAADVAQMKGPSLTGTQSSPLDQLQREARQKTNEAVAEGHHDVEAAKATGAGYVEQAKDLAASAISTARSYLPPSVGGQASSMTGAASNIASTIQSTAASVVDTTKRYLSGQEAPKHNPESAYGDRQSSRGSTGTRGVQTSPASSTGIPATNVSVGNPAATAVDTTKQYVASAREAARPRVEAAKERAEAAKEAVKDTLGRVGTQDAQTSSARSRDIPTTSAPLENGPRSLGTPYPTTTTTTGTNVGKAKAA
ncbi:hypothetical protein LshimejAT787_0302000 [Lyophyllum shimeji]|uniref:Uncharacterized protein n=1 Tax=Lyophyllum shimeji TaxID=47721 RepID=A0A9P3PIC5_LYOSH|nr:hypothetical protein LshimejAT787_0302000 [Lyophyllum shimeji]